MKSLYEAFFSIVGDLHESGIPYAVIGGFAMAFHDVVRGTRDIDLLLLATSLDPAIEVLKQRGFRSSGTPFTVGVDHPLEMHRYVKFEGASHLMIDLAIGQDARTESIVDRSIVVDPGNGPVRIATVEDLIFLKTQRRSGQDRLDIERLRGLDEQDRPEHP